MAHTHQLQSCDYPNNHAWARVGTTLNGTPFKLVSEDQWKTFGLTFGGLLILQQILKQVPSSGHENCSATNGSTSSNGSTNGSIRGSGNNGNARMTAPSGGSGRTLVKDHHYSSL